MKNVAIAAAAAERLRKIHSWLADPALRDTTRGREILIVAPTRGAADDLLRRSGRAGSGVFGAHRLTLRQLAADLATSALAARGLAPVSVLGTEALAARAVSIRTAAGELEYFAPVADAPGFPRALATTLRELRSGGVDAASLAATGAAGADLDRLLATFTAELDRWSLVDGARLLELARREVDRGEHRLVGLPFVLLDLSPTAAQEQLLLARLAAAAPAALAVAQSGDAVGIAALEEIFGVAALDLDGSRGQAPPSRLERLRRRVFLPHLESGTEEPDGDDPSVEFFSAPGTGRECVEIARRIRLGRIPFDRVAVLLRDPEGYLPLVEEALRRAEIPAYFTRGARRPHPAGRALLALLACAAERLSASRFAEYLSLGQVPLPDETGAPPLVEVPWVAPEGDQLVFKTLMPVEPETDPATAEAPVAEDAAGPTAGGTLPRPRGSPAPCAFRTAGNGCWSTPRSSAAAIAGGGGSTGSGRRSACSSKTSTPTIPEGRASSAASNELRHLERFALPVIELLDELPQAATWGEWLDGLSAAREPGAQPAGEGAVGARRAAADGPGGAGDPRRGAPGARRNV